MMNPHEARTVISLEMATGKDPLLDPLGALRLLPAPLHWTTTGAGELLFPGLHHKLHHPPVHGHPMHAQLLVTRLPDPRRQLYPHNRVILRHASSSLLPPTTAE